MHTHIHDNLLYLTGMIFKGAKDTQEATKIKVSLDCLHLPHDHDK